MSHPWIIAGDFSSVLSFEDRIGGNPETVDEMVDF